MLLAITLPGGGGRHQDPLEERSGQQLFNYYQEVVRDKPPPTIPSTRLTPKPLIRLCFNAHSLELQAKSPMIKSPGPNKQSHCTTQHATICVMVIVMNMNTTGDSAGGGCEGGDARRERKREEEGKS